MTTQLRNNNNNNGDKKHAYYQKRFTIYDNLNSALSFGYAYANFSHFGYLEFAPVKDDKRGKEAAKGESIYDYENRQMVSLVAQTAIVARAALESVLTGDADEVSIPLTKDGSKFLSFCKTLAVYGDEALPYEGAISPLTVAVVSQGEEKQYEILNVFVEREIYAINNGAEKVFGCPELELLIKFLDNCINHATTGTFTDAVAAVSIFGGKAAAPAEERTPPPNSAGVKRGTALRGGSASRTTGAAPTGSRLGARTSTAAQAPTDTEEAEAPQQTASTGNRFAAARGAGQVAHTAAPVEEESASLDDFVSSLGGDDTPDFSQEM